jgi:hypothetical protein
MNDDDKGLCPICREKGVKWAAGLNGLASHIEKEHTVRELVYEIATEAIAKLAELRAADPALHPATCSGHGREACEICSLNPASCADGYGECIAYSQTGMHWDTCPNRISTYDKAIKYIQQQEANR